MSELRHCISIKDFSKAEILDLLKLARTYEENTYQPEKLRGKIVATLFFEPSTRTRLSFEAATLRLGGNILGFHSDSSTSVKKGESIEDTIRMAHSYADIIVMRHPENGSAARAAKVSNVPIINGGDGSNEHPTQTLLDLYSIQATQGTLEGLKIVFAGDLKFSRTSHSLIKALCDFKTSFVFASPEQQRLSDELLERVKQAGCEYEERQEIGDLSDADVIYASRMQRERFQTEEEYEKVIGNMQVRLVHLENIKPNFKVLSALPRVDDIALEVDDHPSAYYFDQARNGVYVRQALLEIFSR